MSLPAEKETADTNPQPAPEREPASAAQPARVARGDDGGSAPRAELLPGRAEAARVIWDWRGTRARQASGNRARAVRIRGIGGGAVGGLIGLALYHYVSVTIAMIAFGIAGLTSVAALASPLGAYRWVEKAAGLMALAVGMILTWILLTPVYYGFFLPFSLLFRRGDADQMKRRLDPAAPSYWIKRQDPPPGPAPYERQF
jgi:hypothetical protein